MAHHVPATPASAWPNAHAGDRHQERTFRHWLTQCHTELDKSIRFEQLADAGVQVCARPAFQLSYRLKLALANDILA